MGYVRKNVWTLGSDWSDTVLWYARGVKVLQARPINDPTSWRFYAAIHGFDKSLWTWLQQLPPGTQMPDDSLIKTYWDQCQHGSWYFLPWHRGYILAIENLLRAEIVKLGGPADWAMPYWNYLLPGQNELPPAFNSPDWPDGRGDNPLYVVQRYGPYNDSKVYIPVEGQGTVNESVALSQSRFTGRLIGGSTGFGGVETRFSHSRGHHGMLEQQPHDQVHVDVGGVDPTDRSRNPRTGMMGTPSTAGLDPIFWLHHANIDRLWETWLSLSPAHTNPVDKKWLMGPAASAERAFVMPTPDSEAWIYTPAQMVNIHALGYGYDDIAPVEPVVLPRDRARLLGLKAEAIAVDKTDTDVELLGANAQGIALSGTEARSTVTLARDVQQKVAGSFRAVLGADINLPDRIYLNLENVRSDADGYSFVVFAHVPAAPGVSDIGERAVGSIGLFGVASASDVDGGHPDDGVSYVLDITSYFDDLHLAGNADLPAIEVRLQPRTPIPAEANVTIGRISVYRQSQ